MEPRPTRARPGRRAVIEIPARTILKVVAAAAVVWALLQLVQTILVLVAAALIAVVLDPVVSWLETKKFSRGGAVSLVSLGVLVLVAGFVWLTWSSLVEQSELVGQRIMDVSQDLLDRLPPTWRDAASSSSGQTLSAAGQYTVSLVQSAGSAMTILLLAFVFAFYLLMEGRRVHDWFMAFVPVRYRSRMETTLTEGRRVMAGYMIGNTLTSAIAMAVTFVALWWLEVPAALFLALIAGLSDFIPVVGFFVSAVPALLLAFTVSGKTVLAVAAVYVAYNAVENYIISPWAYGGRMRLSDFAVILAFVVGAELAGVIGALIALPLAALYPAIERVWLRDQLPEETVREHKALESNEGG